ncbi:hypothetical protein BLOT_012885 [Blomia tropicalis]|nr:hypothetical protein BLOT_012885 [Blomia tropicalis]
MGLGCVTFSVYALKQFYSGIQLYEVSWNNWRTWIPFTISIWTILSVAYSIIYPFENEVNFDEFESTFRDQPLFRILIQFYLIYSFTALTICRLIFYLFNGSRLIRLLTNSFDLNRTYHLHISRSRAYRLASIALILPYIYSAPSYDRILRLDWNDQLIQSIIYTITYHTIALIDIFLLLSLHYGQWLFHQSILDLNECFEQRNHLHHSHRYHQLPIKTIDTIVRLAKVSHNFYWLQSTPILIYGLNTTIDTIFYKTTQN